MVGIMPNNAINSAISVLSVAAKNQSNAQGGKSKNLEAQRRPRTN